MRRILPRTVLIPLVLALAACQSADVGQECTITWGSEPLPDAYCNSSGKETVDGKDVACFTISADLFETGNIECENPVCIMSPTTSGATYDRAPAKGFCSKACVTDADCFTSKTALVCRQIVLDDVFIQKLDPAVKDMYLGKIEQSRYCAIP